MALKGPGGTVAVALSGGSDSTAAACILKERGFELLGLTMYTPEFDRGGTDIVSVASAVAEDIGIEHQIVDIGPQFERRVIQPFLHSYVSGETPNPCIACNREIKFGFLLEEARKRGCEYLATGHYAAVEGGGADPFQIVRAVDREKDQTYVLWTLDQSTLGSLLFPLGDLTKQEASSIVRGCGVRHTAPESQDICFLRGDSYASFVEERAMESIRTGPIVDTEGKVLGSHRGLPFYTVGQRRGLGLGGPMAMYVLEIDPARNTLVVGEGDRLSIEQFQVMPFNFISGAPPTNPFECRVKTRYRGSLLPARVEPGRDNTLTVLYFEPGPPAAPGQSAVFYSGNRLLGGGVIVRGHPILG